MQAKRKFESDSRRSKKQRCVITLEEKLRIIRMHEDGKILSKIAREINRPISTVSTIVKDKVRISESAKDAVTLSGTIITKKRQGPISEMEKLLAQWIEEMTEKETPLTLAIIQEKARSLHKQLLEKAGMANAENTFKASAGWFERFKKRVNLNGFKIAGGETNGGAQTSNGFPKNQIKLPVEKKFSTDELADVFNLIDIALAKLEAMDPDAERFENISRRIYSNLSSYKSIYYEKKRLSTTTTHGTCLRCRSHLTEENPDDFDYPQASTGESEEVEGEQISCSQLPSPSGESESVSLGIARHFLINN